MSLPFTRVPLALPKSTSDAPWSEERISAWRRLTDGSSMRKSALCERPMSAPALISKIRPRCFPRMHRKLTLEPVALDAREVTPPKAP